MIDESRAVHRDQGAADARAAVGAQRLDREPHGAVEAVVAEGSCGCSRGEVVLPVERHRELKAFRGCHLRRTPHAPPPQRRRGAEQVGLLRPLARHGRLHRRVVASAEAAARVAKRAH